MTNLEITSLASAKSCSIYLDQHPTVWNTIPILKQYVELFKDSLQNVEDINQKRLIHDGTGLTRKKNNDIHTIIKKFYQLDRKLTMLAKISKIPVLLSVADISENAFMEKGINSATDHCITILNLGRQYLPQLVSLDVTAAKLDALEVELNTAKALPA